VIDVRDAGPATAVERDAEDQFARGHAGLEVRLDGEVDVEVIGEVGILRAVKERGGVIGRGLPGAVEVVALHVVEIERARHLGQFDVGEVLLSGGAEHGQEVMVVAGAAKGIELRTEFAHQGRRVRSVGRGRELPVNVNAVEDAGG